jgi:hypothetical protein
MKDNQYQTKEGVKDDKYEAASEIGIIDASSLADIKDKELGINETKKLVEKARSHFIGFK